MSNNPSFFNLYFSLFIRPSRTFEQILQHEHKLRFGLLALLIPGLGYTLFYAMAWQAGGSPSTFKPWLALPIEKYFFYDIFLSLPAVFLSLVAAAGIIQLLSKPFRGSGTFEDTFTVLASGAAVATWSTLLHDLTDAFLGFIGAIDMKEYEAALNSPTFWRALLWTLFPLYFAWFILLFTKGIRKAQKLPVRSSILLGVTALLIYQVILLIFIR